MGVLSVALHLSAFYVFEAVYPGSRKQIQREGVAWYLDRRDGAARAALSAVDPRLTVFSGRERSGEPDPGAAVVIPRLATDRHVPELAVLDSGRERGGMRYPEAVPDLLPPIVPLDGAGGQATAAGGEPMGTWKWVANVDRAGPNGGSGVIAAEAPAGLAGKWGQLLAGRPAMLQVAVDESGRVREVAFLEGPGPPLEAELRADVLGVRAPDGVARPEAGKLGWVTLQVAP